MTSERVNARTYAHTSGHAYAHVCPLVRHASVHSLTRTLGRTHVRHHVHLHSSPDVRSSRSLPFTRLKKKQCINVYIYIYYFKTVPALRYWQKKSVLKKKIIPRISLADSLFSLQYDKTIIKIDPSAACSAAHAPQNPTLPISLQSLKLPPPPCAVLPVSVSQNEAKKIRSI